MKGFSLGCVCFLLATPVWADDHLIATVDASVTVNPGQSLITYSTSNSGFTPTLTIGAASAYWYSQPISGVFAAGDWQFLLWTGSPGCPSEVTVEIGSTGVDGSGFSLLASQTQDINASGLGNHISTFDFGTLAAQALLGRLLRVRIVLASGCSAVMVYNAGVDFDTRLVTPGLGAAGSPTPVPSSTATPTPSPTPAPALVKSVNTSSALAGQTFTYTLAYRNPNPSTGSTCQDTFESGATLWPSGWSAPTGGAWALTAANGPSLPGVQALDASETGGYNFTELLCAGQVTDGSIQADADILTAAGQVSFLWRQNGSSTYQFHVQQGSSGNISLRVITNAAFNEIAVGSATITQGQWYTLLFTVTGFSLTASINGVPVLSATDPNQAYNSGAAGIEIDDPASAGLDVRFDNVLVTSSPLAWYRVSLVDTLPAGLAYVSDTCGGSAAGQVWSAGLGTLAAGATGSCSVAVGAVGCPGALVNQALIEAGLPAFSTTSNSVTTTVSCASPTTTSTVSPSPSPSPRNTPSNTPTMNASPSATASATPSGTSSTSPTASRTATVSPSSSPTCTQSPLPSASNSRTPSPVPSATATPAMALVKSASASVATLGDTITFCMAWSNDSSASQPIAVWDTVSPYLTYLGCSNGCGYGAPVVSWNLGSQASHSTGTLCFWARVTGYP